jgi:hypothetical protein
MVPDEQSVVLRINSEGLLQTPLNIVGMQVPGHGPIGGTVVAADSLFTQQVPPVGQNFS